jgi:hypothetical protein
VIRIGTAGWKYKDWDGMVYPKPKPRGFDELAGSEYRIYKGFLERSLIFWRPKQIPSF